MSDNLLFSDRVQVVLQYRRWLIDHDGIADDPLSFIGFLFSKGYLNEKTIIKEVRKK